MFMFLFLIFVRRQLLNKAQDLDRDAYTPADYCLMGTSMAFDDYAQLAVENHLKGYFKDRFDLDIVYANACYNIDDFYKVSERFNEVSKKKGIIQFFCKEHDITEEAYKAEQGNDPEDYPRWKSGVCSTAVLNLDEVEAEFKEVEELIKGFEDRAGNAGAAEEQEAAFTGIVFVVFERPGDCYKVANG